MGILRGDTNGDGEGWVSGQTRILTNKPPHNADTIPMGRNLHGRAKLQDNVRRSGGVRKMK